MEPVQINPGLYDPEHSYRKIDERPQSEIFADLLFIVEKLGVKPAIDNISGAMLVHVDGLYYNMWDIFKALIARIEKLEAENPL